MKALPIIAAAGLAICATWRAAAEDLSIKKPPPAGWHGEGVVITPGSSVAKPGDAGKRAHTNTKIFKPVDPTTPDKHPDGDVRRK
jgi:hypothetical protein